MKKKGTILLLLIIFVILAVCVIGAIDIWNVWNEFSDYSTCLQANWGFSLPPDAHYSEVYQQDEGPSFHGDGIRYHVFSYKEAMPIEEMLSWQTEEGFTRRDGSYSEAADEWLNKIGVPLEERPNYSECSYWYKTKNDSSEIIIFWDKNQSKLYIAEFFL